MKIIDGTLHFKDLTSFDNNLKTINSNLSSYKLFSIQNNFESFYTKIDQIQKQVDNVIAKSGTQDQILDIYKFNHKYYYWNVDYFEIDLDLLVYAPILNLNKVFYIDNALYYFDREGQIIISKGNEKEKILENTLKSRKNDLQNGISVFNNTPKKGGLRAACGTYFNSGWINIPDNSRRGKLITESKVTQFFQGGSYYRYDFFQYYRGDTQKKVLGIFVTYSTNHLLTITNNDLKAPTIPLTNSAPYTHLTVNLDVSFDNQTYIYYTSATVHTWSNVAQYPSYAPVAPDYLNITYTTQGGVNMNHTCQ